MAVSQKKPLVVAKFGGGTLGPEAVNLPRVLARIRELSAEGPVVVVVSAPLSSAEEGKRAASMTDVGIGLGQQIAAGAAADPSILWTAYQRIAARSLREGSLQATLQALGESEAKVRAALREVGEYRKFAGTVRARVLGHGGECAMAVVVDAALRDAGLRSTALPFSEHPVVTDDDAEQATFLHPESRERSAGLQAALEQHQVVVVPGFIGRTVAGAETTYERGGSDRTAIDLGVLLCDRYAVTVEFAKEGPVMSADPRVERRNLEHVEHLTLLEATEAARFGMKLLDPLALRDLKHAPAPVRMRVTDIKNPAVFTTLGEEGAPLAENPLKMVVGKSDCALVRLESGAAAHLVMALERQRQYHEFVSLSPFLRNAQWHARLLFLDAAFVRANERLIRAYDPNAEIAFQRGVVTVIGERLQGVPGAASAICGALADKALKLLNLDIQEETSRMLVVVEQQPGGSTMEEAVRAIHGQRGALLAARVPAKS